jgi:hypothetical protein
VPHRDTVDLEGDGFMRRPRSRDGVAMKGNQIEASAPRPRLQRVDGDDLPLVTVDVIGQQPGRLAVDLGNQPRKGRDEVMIVRPPGRADLDEVGTGVELLKQ